jgi:hypothetical protein
MVDFSEDLPATVIAQFDNQDDEDVMITDALQKYTSLRPETEDRLYVMTTDNIYTFKKGKKSRKYKIKDVSAIFQASDNNQDFMLFFERDEDLHVNSAKRDELVQILQLRFINFNRNITLRIYNVPSKDLNLYKQTNN